MKTNRTDSRPEAQANRLGPRPLPLHLGSAILTWTSSRAASESLKSGSLPWSPEIRPEANRLRQDLTALLDAAGPAEAAAAHREFTSAVEREIETRSGRLIDGILAYRRHPYRRPADTGHVVWEEGTTRLLRHGDGEGVPILLVPSLVNRYYVLDIGPGRSLLDHLGRSGFAPYVVDWGRPGEIERTFTLTDYISGRLDQALDAVLEETGRRPVLNGYCMGGLLALALAQRRQRDIAALVLMATPWDFSADAGAAPAILEASKPALGGVLDTLGELPTDIIQSMFTALDPLLVVRKFLKFAEMDMTGEEAEAFVALEDWINDGVPLAAPVARETLFGWYGENATMRGTWRVAGRPVDPGAVKTPSLVLVPSRDRIVPPDSATALASGLPNATELRTALGHIGMVASSGARERAWNTMIEWMEQFDE